MAEIACVGLVGPETIKRGSYQHVRLGGVAYNVAQSLRWEGHDVKVWTALGEDRVSQQTRDLLTADQMSWRSKSKGRSKPMYYSARLQNGEPSKGSTGRFPTLDLEDFDLAQLEEEVEAVDWVVTETNVSEGVLTWLAYRAVNLAIVVSAPSRAHRLQGLVDKPVPGQLLICLNERELSRVPWQGPLAGFAGLMLATGVLCTRGIDGWDHWDGERERHGLAVPVPAGADFLGCGDAAAAAMVTSRTEHLTAEACIARCVQRRLEWTAGRW